MVFMRMARERSEAKKKKIMKKKRIQHIQCDTAHTSLVREMNRKKKLYFFSALFSNSKTQPNANDETVNYEDENK